MPIPNYPFFSEKPSLLSRIESFLGNLFNKKSYTTFYSKKLKLDGKKWLHKLPKTARAEGKKVLDYIDNVVDNNLKNIDLSKFTIPCIPEELIARWLPKLQKENFSNCKINNMEFLNTFKKLKFLKLNNCQLQAVENINLPELEYLDLSGNQLREFKKCYFPKVSFIKLKNNEFSSLKTIIDTFPELSTLNTSRNQLTTTIDLSFFILSRKITSINLSNNPLPGNKKPRVSSGKELKEWLEKYKIYIGTPNNNPTIPIMLQRCRRETLKMTEWEDLHTSTTRKVETVDSGNRIINHLAAWVSPVSLTNNECPPTARFGSGRQPLLHSAPLGQAAELPRLTIT